MDVTIERFGVCQYSTGIESYFIQEIADPTKELLYPVTVEEVKKHLNQTNVIGNVSEWEGAADDNDLFLDIIEQAASELESILYLPILPKTYKITLRLSEARNFIVLPLPNVTEIYEGSQANNTITISQLQYFPEYSTFKPSVDINDNDNFTIKFVAGFNNVNLLPKALRLALLKLCAYHWTNRGDFDEASGYPVLGNLLKPFYRYPENEYSTSFFTNAVVRLPRLCQFHG